MPRRSDTRRRVLDASTQIFRRQGYAATGLKQIVSEGEAPVGSLYHFFPGGKEQVAVQALARWGERSAELIERIFTGSEDPAAAAVFWFGLAAQALLKSDYADGCPVGAVACEVAGTNEALRVVCAEAFEAWQARVAIQLIAEGVSRQEAKELASFAVAALEGAYMMSRIARSTKPLEDSGKHVAASIGAATRPNRRRIAKRRV